MTKNMYTVAGDGPCNEELALRIQAGDKNAAERLLSQNEGYLTKLARAYTPWCELEDLKQEAALALLDAARRFNPAYGTKLLTYATPAIEAALSDYASRYAFPLSVPTSRGSQLRTVAHLCTEAQDASESELTKAVCEKLKVSSKSAEALLKEYQTLCCTRQLGDAVFSGSCGGDPAVAYDRLMRRTLLMQRMEEVLTPRELNLVRSYLGIGQPDEVGLTFQELAIRLNYNGPSGAEKALANRFACEVAALICVFTRCSAELDQKSFKSKCNKTPFPCITRMTGEKAHAQYADDNRICAGRGSTRAAAVVAPHCRRGA